MEIKVDRPKLIEISILNDDVTSVDTVKVVLVNVFGFDVYEADSLIDIVMEEGECSLGKYSMGVARNLISEIRQYSNTLQVKSKECEYNS